VTELEFEMTPQADRSIGSGMEPVLIADIGATNSRFALAGPGARPERMVKYRGDDIASFEDGIDCYVRECGVRPQAAVLAIAAPVEGDAITMTNRRWSFRLSELARRYDWRAVRGLNDFEAVAWALTRLQSDDARPIGPVSGGRKGPRVVFGPGTGLGVAALVPAGEGWRPVPSEGGHVVFGPATDDEQPVFARLRAAEGMVSAEKVLSGPGIPRLHRAVHDSDEMLTPADVVSRAHAGDAAAQATIALFVRLFGRFAGDLALTFRAFGGVYIGGGVARRLGRMLDADAFRAAFQNHPPYADLLETIPTTLITFDEPGLIGCAALAETLTEGEGL
jgi:glucokinase